MADNLCKKPRKGILKNSSSFEGNGRQRDKETKWDEMNILATLHPADKDYGHMKIDEPKTPYTHYDGESGDEHDGLDADLLAQKIQLGGSEMPKALMEAEEESEEEEDLSPEEKEKRKFFEMKRKMHYNEFYAVKLARKLMEAEDDTDEDDESDDKKGASKGGKSEEDNFVEPMPEAANAKSSTSEAMATEEPSGD